nr:coatomer subunit gamma [Quercus suber]
MPDMDPHRAGPSIQDVLTRQDVHRSSLLWDAPLAGEEVPGVLTCRHQEKGLLEEQYIDPCYNVDALFQSYAPVFPVLKDKLSWPNHTETRKVLPNSRLIREKGRPVSTRIRNEMDKGRRRPRTTPWNEGGRKVQCRLCDQVGHNQRTCPKQNEVDPTTSETEDDGVKDEYQLEDLEVVAADYMLKVGSPISEMHGKAWMLDPSDAEDLKLWPTPIEKQYIDILLEEEAKENMPSGQFKKNLGPFIKDEFNR